MQQVVPLAFPRGKDTLCELCQGAARLQCSECRVTFYCTAEHQQADWVGIHERICQLLVPIRTSTLVSLQQAGHNETELDKVRISVMHWEHIKLSEGKHQEALPAAQFCLRCSKDVYGPSTVKMVPAYLLLAEANMALGNLSQVAELLSQAEWAGLKSPEHSAHHQLHRSLGRLHTATGNLEAALFHFANDIYFASEEYGLDSTVTCGGFFLMADVFAKQEKIPTARSLFSKVAQTWHCHLTKLLETHAQNLTNKCIFAFILNFQSGEARRMLKVMLEFEQNYIRKDSAQIALVAYCLAMLWFLGGDSIKVSHLTRCPGNKGSHLFRCGMKEQSSSVSGKFRK
uniref:Zinc finger, MYND-type containing 12 n=1 Tax=Cyclopterus lumpus TaxID=8103 RepID=A0A8C2WZV2_CYCLU